MPLIFSICCLHYTESSDSTVFDFLHCKCTDLGLALKLSYKCCWNWMEAPNLFYWLLYRNFLSMQRIDRSLKFNYVKNWHIGAWVPLHTLHTYMTSVREWGDSPWFSVACHSLSLLPPWFTAFIIKKQLCWKSLFYVLEFEIGILVLNTCIDHRSRQRLPWNPVHTSKISLLTISQTCHAWCARNQGLLQFILKLLE